MRISDWSSDVCSSDLYNRGDLPLGVWPEDTPENGLSISETIKDIDSNGSWMVLKNVERDRDYAALLHQSLGEILPAVKKQTGPMLHMEAFIFLSSPGRITPFHMDTEHNLQIGQATWRERGG